MHEKPSTSPSGISLSVRRRHLGRTELTEFAWKPLPLAVWWGTLYLGVVSTSLAFYLWNKGFTLMDAATGSLFFFAQPVVGAVLGWLLLGESLTAWFLLGTAVLIAGGVLATRYST